MTSDKARIRALRKALRSVLMQCDYGVITCPVCGGEDDMKTLDIRDEIAEALRRDRRIARRGEGRP